MTDVEFSGVRLGPGDWLVLTPRNWATEQELAEIRDHIPEGLRGRIVIANMDAYVLPATSERAPASRSALTAKGDS